jgi:hypothetical protein
MPVEYPSTHSAARNSLTRRAPEPWLLCQAPRGHARAERDCGQSAWNARWPRWPPRTGRVKLRYRGVTKNNAWLHTRAGALNLRTLIRRGLTRAGGAWVLAPA